MGTTDRGLGRPRSEAEALRSTVAAVVNRHEREQIERLAEAKGVSLSAIVRQGVRVVLTATHGLGASPDANDDLTGQTTSV